MRLSGNLKGALDVSTVKQLILDAPVQLGMSLSAEMRAETAPLHRETEDRLGLPGAIRTREEYKVLLARFHGFYQPIEARLDALTCGTDLGPMLHARRQTPGLRADLLALGVHTDGQPVTPVPILPELPDFASALGAHYVLEGSTLGGILILKALETRLGAEIAGATQFFGGRGKSVGPMWRTFRAELDAFGETWPSRRAEAVAGAQRTFQAMLTWCAQP